MLSAGVGLCGWDRVRSGNDEVRLSTELDLGTSAWLDAVGSCGLHPEAAGVAVPGSVLELAGSEDELTPVLAEAGSVVTLELLRLPSGLDEFMVGGWELRPWRGWKPRINPHRSVAPAVPMSAG